jgi:hypothetical protein
MFNPFPPCAVKTKNILLTDDPKHLRQLQRKNLVTSQDGVAFPRTMRGVSKLQSAPAR